MRLNHFHKILRLQAEYFFYDFFLKLLFNIYTRKLYNMLLNNAIYIFVLNPCVVMELSSK